MGILHRPQLLRQSSFLSALTVVLLLEHAHFLIVGHFPRLRLISLLCKAVLHLSVYSVLSPSPVLELTPAGCLQLASPATLILDVSPKLILDLPRGAELHHKGAVDGRHGLQLMLRHAHPPLDLGLLSVVRCLQGPALRLLAHKLAAQVTAHCSSSLELQRESLMGILQTPGQGANGLPLLVAVVAELPHLHRQPGLHLLSFLLLCRVFPHQICVLTS
mmetsp:Transcript_59415/g.128481  ORF Transcript_59415/g.128481 Transcript_59415/m.128481 type:complete len:218 (+) Transcript_59415:616-1269(+)